MLIWVHPNRLKHRRRGYKQLLASHFERRFSDKDNRGRVKTQSPVLRDSGVRFQRFFLSVWREARGP
ncbi:unnamed protein product, partial [Mycena citricolor]